MFAANPSIGSRVNGPSSTGHDFKYIASHRIVSDHTSRYYAPHHVAPKSMTTSFCSDPALRTIASTSSRDVASKTCPPRMLRKGGSFWETPNNEGAAVSDCLDGQEAAMVVPGALVAPIVGTTAKRSAIKLQNRRENIVMVVILVSYDQMRSPSHRRLMDHHQSDSFLKDASICRQL
jgi:hypothetical protein